MKINVICSYKDFNSLVINKIADSNCREGKVYISPENINLETYANELTDEINELKKRYKYLEKSRKWIINNIKEFK